MDGLWVELRNWGADHGKNAAQTALLILVGVLVLRYLIAPFRRLLERSRMQPSGASFLANTARGVVLVVIVVGVLQQLGVETTSLLTVLAAAGLAVALSLQNTLANFTAGLLLLAFRMVRVGDVIDVGGLRGRVADLYPFHVVLISDDNQTLTLPNSLLTGGGVRNLSALPLRRAQWSLPLPAGADLGAAREALLGRLRADPRVLAEPAPRVFVQEWAADKRVLAVQAWTSAADNLAVQEELLEALGLAVEALRPRPADSAGDV